MDTLAKKSDFQWTPVLDKTKKRRSPAKYRPASKQQTVDIGWGFFPANPFGPQPSNFRCILIEKKDK